jgi:hypothetical protein
VTGEQEARRPLDPVIAGFFDGIHAGSQALELVVQGLHEGLRRQTARRDAPPRATAGARESAGRFERGAAGRFQREAGAQMPSRALIPAAQARPRGTLVHQLLGVFDEFLGAASTLTRSMADLHGAPDDETTPDASAPYLLQLQAYPGRTDTGEFVVWNTGASAMSDMRFRTTELISDGASIERSAIAFKPFEVPRIGPGASATIEVSVNVPRDATPGRYHAIIQPSVGGAWAVVDLEVFTAYPK